jgi:high-affinity Fe2+/Pb2+ permease
MRILKSIALLACATAAAALLGRYGIRLGGEGRNFAW